MTQGRRSRGVRATKKGIETLEERRLSKGWTLEALANRADVSLDTVERLRDRVKKVDRESVRKIVRPLNLQPTEIIDSDEWDGTSKEAKLAQQLRIALNGQNVFIAEEKMRQRADWFKYFTKELEQCNCYVLLLSSEAAVSEVVIEEVRYVRELHHSPNKPAILWIQIGLDVVLNSDVYDYLTKFPSLNWTSTDDTSAIVEAIQNLLVIPPTPPTSSGDYPTDPVPLREYPTGQVPLDSASYIERPPIESNCYQEVLHPGALIRIKAPRQMGKTSLMARVLNQARANGYQTVCLSFQLASSEVLSNLDKLMRWVCASVSKKLHLPNQLVEYWDDIFDGNYNSTTYFENYLLAETGCPLVIGFDEIDRVFDYPNVANDFLGLLRAWYEKARYGDQDSDTWQKLRFVIVHSTEVYIPMNLSQSPFNVGLSIELLEFTQEQVQDLAQRYQLSWTIPQVEQLMGLVGGHPYLVRITMYQVAYENITLEQALSQATTESSCYGNHLRGQLWNLGKYPELAMAFSQVVNTNTPVSLESVLAFKLYSLGLVKLEGNQVTPRCELYLQYFRDR